ncbi:MAG: 5'-3' exonuclease H3TH domain-containing protein, partial [Bryocella sp.]
DSMAFIFRAYHAMQRSRPMTTRTGIPTAATYVFVNMINKLRKDFSPHYLAAVYDVGAPLLRNEQAKQMKDVKKFNIRTQQFETTEYGGYKANRSETPPDLIQQQPYIRRALEAFRIPIIYYEGYEADDVIGTLSCQFSALGHHVYVVSSDKDMMQLVNKNVSMLNPPKDNLILDPAGVEAVLGVPPHKVIDVMALRGDSIDNIPGAPGIGDKGSVELIQQFGTVEAAMDAAIATPELIKRKVYRESLANNRDNILLSKELVTIHTAVPIEVTLEQMRTQPVDNAACRALFTELEFTTLLKELAPDVTATVAEYKVRAADDELTDLLQQARKAGHLAVAIAETTQSISEELAAESSDATAEGEAEPEPEAPQTMSLFAAAVEETHAAETELADIACVFGLAVEPTHAISVTLDAVGLRTALEDETLTKQVHDLKAVLRALEPHGIALRGPIIDVMLQSYLLNPTHGSHTLADIAARSTSRALMHQPTKLNPSDPKRLPEAATA